MLTETEIEALRASRKLYHSAPNVSGLNVRLERGTYFVSDAGGTFLCALSKQNASMLFELIWLENLNGAGTVEELLKPSTTLEEIGL